MAEPSKEQISIALDRYEQRASELLRYLEEYYKIHESYTQVYERLVTFSDKLRHSTFIPIGNHAFIPGQITNTNQLTAHIGDGYYREMTVRQSIELVTRRIAGLEKDIAGYHRELDVFGQHIKHAHQALGHIPSAPSVGDQMKAKIVSSSSSSSSSPQNHQQQHKKQPTITKCGVNDDGEDILDIIEFEDDADGLSHDMDNKHTDDVSTTVASSPIVDSGLGRASVTKTELLHILGSTQPSSFEHDGYVRDDYEIYADHTFLAHQQQPPSHKRHKLVEVLSEEDGDGDGDDGEGKDGPHIDHPTTTPSDPTYINDVLPPSLAQQQQQQEHQQQQQQQQQQEHQQQQQQQQQQASNKEKVESMRQLILDSMVHTTPPPVSPIPTHDQSLPSPSPSPPSLSDDTATHPLPPTTATSTTSLSSPDEVTASREAYQRYLLAITAGDEHIAPFTTDLDEIDDDIDVGDEDWEGYLDDLDDIYGMLGEGEDTLYEDLLWDHLQSVVSSESKDGGLLQSYTPSQRKSEEQAQAEMLAANSSTVVPNHRPLYASFGVHTDHQGGHVLAHIGALGDADEHTLPSPSPHHLNEAVSTDIAANLGEVKPRSRKPRHPTSQASQNPSPATSTPRVSKFKQQRNAAQNDTP